MGSRAWTTGDDKPSVCVMGRGMRPLSYPKIGLNQARLNSIRCPKSATCRRFDAVGNTNAV
nr:MAG TPA: antimicrobial protein [Caudoviricetes sp.]